MSGSPLNIIVRMDQQLLKTCSKESIKFDCRLGENGKNNFTEEMIEKPSKNMFHTT